MKWKKKNHKIYDRSEANEEAFYWLNLFFQDENRSWDIYDEFSSWDYDWWDFPGSGSVHNMDEYHAMNVMTLLRKLNIGTARTFIRNRGW